MRIQCPVKKARYSRSITSMDKNCKEMQLCLHLFQPVFNAFCSKFRNHHVRDRRDHGNEVVRISGCLPLCLLSAFHLSLIHLQISARFPVESLLSGLNLFLGIKPDGTGEGREEGSEGGFVQPKQEGQNLDKQSG